jgi:isopropylmalate/homocitrate/citramalate synthase
MRCETPYKCAMWFVSPYNFIESVRARFKAPEKVIIHDTTLRDGEQQPGIVFKRDEKVEIAMALDEAGVDRIEAGMPAVSRDDFEAIKTLSKQGLNAKIFAFTRCLKSDVDLALKADVSHLVMELPSSKHLIRFAYRWSEDKAIERAVEAVEYAKQHGLYVTFFAIDATRSDIEFLRRVIMEVHDYMDSLAVADTLGVCTPYAIEYIIRELKSFVKKPIEVHTHNDFGLAVANAIAGVLSGAEVVHVTVNGIGERCGNAPLEETVMAFELLLGIKTNVKLEKLYKLSKLVEEKSKLWIPPNKAVTGENVFRIESGIIADWWLNVKDIDPTIAIPYKPSLVGRSEVEIVLGKKSGKANIVDKLRYLNLTLSDQEIADILNAVKEKSIEKKGLLTLEEFKVIVENVLQRKLSTQS